MFSFWLAKVLWTIVFVYLLWRMAWKWRGIFELVCAIWKRCLQYGDTKYQGNPSQRNTNASNSMWYSIHVFGLQPIHGHTVLLSHLFNCQFTIKTSDYKGKGDKQIHQIRALCSCKSILLPLFFTSLVNIHLKHVCTP